MLICSSILPIISSIFFYPQFLIYIYIYIYIYICVCVCVCVCINSMMCAEELQSQLRVVSPEGSSNKYNKHVNKARNNSNILKKTSNTNIATVDLLYTEFVTRPTKRASMVFFKVSLGRNPDKLGILKNALTHVKILLKWSASGTRLEE